MPLSPLRTGTAFALTIAVLYVACLLLMLVAPGVVLDIFSTWVHGLNLEPITTNPPPVNLTRAALGLVLISAYAFIAGAVYGVVRRGLTPKR
ncbi:DUF5676 family membrane protein [Lysobacter terrae]